MLGDVEGIIPRERTERDVGEAIERLHQATQVSAIVVGGSTPCYDPAGELNPRTQKTLTMAAEPKTDSANIVLAGFWNPSILLPDWIAKNVFGTQEPEPVEMQLSPVLNQPPRYRLRDMTFVPAYDRLMIFPHSLEQQRLEDCESRAICILDLLPHTPIRAVGINFEFVDEHPTAELLTLFSDIDNLAEGSGLNFETTVTSLTRTLVLNGAQLKFTRELGGQGAVTYRFNFHYPVTDAAAARGVFNHSFVQNLATARAVMAVYDNWHAAEA